MTILQAVNLYKSYGSVDIFAGISVSVPPDARIAIVGPNGIGKTTLLRVLTRQEEPSDGVVRISKDLEIGFLPQEAGLDGTHTLWEECLGAMAELLEMEAELNHLERLMSDPAHADSAIEQYGVRQEEFERRGGYTYETRIRSTLSGLGFTDVDLVRPLTQLSGGQRTRAYLARLLLSPESKVRPAVFAGPMIAYELSSTAKISSAGVSDTHDIEDTKKWDYGVAFGAGLELGRGAGGFSLDFLYILGLANIARLGEIKNREALVLVGYSF